MGLGEGAGFHRRPIACLQGTAVLSSLNALSAAFHRSRMHLRVAFALIVLVPVVHADAAHVPTRSDYFGIEVLDQETRRGVPMVELQTTSGVSYYTDSKGLIAFYEPGLMNHKVWFAVSSHGYEFAPDGFGLRGVTLETKPGRISQLKIKRLN